MKVLNLQKRTFHSNFILESSKKESLKEMKKLQAKWP